MCFGVQPTESPAPLPVCLPMSGGLCYCAEVKYSHNLPSNLFLNGIYKLSTDTFNNSPYWQVGDVMVQFSASVCNSTVTLCLTQETVK